MKKILVSGASGIVGYGVLKSLRSSGRKLTLIGTAMYDDSVAPGFCDVFEQAPPTAAPDYLTWLKDTIARHEIDLIIPGIEIDMYTWEQHAAEIEGAGCRILLNRTSLVQLCRDKWKFYEVLRAQAPQYTIDSSLENDFDRLVGTFGSPFLLKPRRGFGSKGIVRVADAASFAAWRNDMGGILMAQPIVGDDEQEYTTSAFCDGEGGYRAYMTLRRKLSKDGFTDKAEVAEPPGIEEALRILCAIFKPLGPTNFQFRLHAGQLKLLEINPRISSSTSIRTAFGYNESDMAVAWLLEGQAPVQPTIRRGKAVRYTEDFIFYEDRTNL
ncbi:ATP-grasp domain-containing protein [Herbaspirillum sp. NPDC087042]|uniref:ATP-grasp domain-containing protein n=1 Tax=Herbaspirillum sp. NPDC087042 TaxID=3364004 RepID=UPI00382EAF72